MAENPHASFDEIKKLCDVAQHCGKCEPNALRFYAQRCHHEPKVDASIKKTRCKLFITKCIRNFHLFSSLIAAIFLLFFAFTGYLMNHSSEWGLDDIQETEHTLTLPDTLKKNHTKEAIVAWCHANGARGELAEFISENGTINVTCVNAGQNFEAEIDLDSGEVNILIQKNSFLESLAEIHRSPSADGKSTSLFIDTMAVLMAIVSLSGIFLFFRMATRENKLALLTFVLSIAAAITVYYQLAM